MIEKLSVHSVDDSPVEWWPEGLSELSFAPGLNVLWGSNRCGKSTVLKLISRLFYCDNFQGMPLIDLRAVRRFPMERQRFVDRPRQGWKVLASPMRAVLFDPMGRNKPYGMMDIVNESADRGRQSHGEFVLKRFRDFLEKSRKLPTKVQRPGDRFFLQWEKDCRIDHMDGELPSLVYLLDEPTRSLDLHRQSEMVSTIKGLATSHQVIVATHSPLLLSVEANHIDVEPGYREKCIEMISGMSVASGAHV